MIDDRTILLAVIGCYAFTFVAWRNITNHIYHKLDDLTGQLAALQLGMSVRLTALETKIESLTKEVS